MTDLSRDARSLIGRARAHEGPSPQDRARMRAKLAPQWKAAAAAALAPPAAQAPARNTWTWASIAKTIVLLAVAAWNPVPPSAAKTVPSLGPSAIEPAVAANHDAPQGSAALPAANDAPADPSPLAAAPRVRASGQGSRARARPAAAGGSSRQAAESPVTARVQAPSRTRADAVSGQAIADESGTVTSPSVARSTLVSDALDRRSPPELAPEQFQPQPLDDELAWIGAAQEALRNHKPSQALRLAEQHGFRFPQGALTQERLVVHTLALCALERFDAARRMLAVLEERAPGAPIVARVRSNCGL